MSNHSESLEKGQAAASDANEEKDFGYPQMPLNDDGLKRQLKNRHIAMIRCVVLLIVVGSPGVYPITSIGGKL